MAIKTEITIGEKQKKNCIINFALNWIWHWSRMSGVWRPTLFWQPNYLLCISPKTLVFIFFLKDHAIFLYYFSYRCLSQRFVNALNFKKKKKHSSDCCQHKFVSWALSLMTRQVYVSILKQCKTKCWSSLKLFEGQQLIESISWNCVDIKCVIGFWKPDTFNGIAMSWPHLILNNLCKSIRWITWMLYWKLIDAWSNKAL